METDLGQGAGGAALLSLVALAGTPLCREVAAAAAGLGLSDYNRVEAQLRAANLVRTSGNRTSDFVEHYHDRVRETVLARLDATDRLQLHRDLAEAVEVTSRSPDELAIHWREAGEPEKASFYAAQAAALAADALAFDRAARAFISKRSELQTLSGAGGRALRVALGEALANAGHGAEAAAEFAKAADGASESAALDLERRAAEQLLRAGLIDEGLERLRQVLAKAGVPMAKTPRRALVSLLWGRARLWLRGIGFRQRREEEIPAAELARFDVCYTAALGMAMVDTVRGADFQARALLLGLACGEPRRIARAVALEAANSASAGTSAHRRTAHLVAVSREVARAVGDPHATGVAVGSAGIAAYLEGRFDEARRLCDMAEATFRDRCVGALWEWYTSQLFSLWSLVYLGELRELAQRMPRAIREAESRGDRFAATSLRTGTLTYYWLAADDPAGAEREADEAMRRWSKLGFLHQHWDDLLARCEIDLYRGQPQAALDRVTARWSDLTDAYLLMIQVSRVEAYSLRARAALACALAAAAGSDERRLFLKRARADARRIGREKAPWTRPLAQLLDGAIAAAQGQPERARERLATSVAGFGSVGMQLHRAAAERLLGQLEGGDAGGVRVVTADEWMARQGVVAPARLAALLAPG